MGDTTWSHQNKEWQKTLDLARSFGWDPPQKMGNHGGLLLKCPASDTRHQIRIFSTGSGTETKAIDFRKKIRNCPHRNLSEPLARIETGLSGAERLLDAVEAHLRVVEAETRMEELLESLDMVDEQLAAVQEEFDSTAAVAEEAKEDLAEQFRHRSPADLAAEAGTSLRGAELGLRDDLPTEHEDWRDLRDRHDALKRRLNLIRELLSTDG